MALNHIYGGKKMAEMLIVRSKVKAVAKKKGMSFGADAADALSAAVEDMVNRAVERAKANGRKTIKGRDI
jgi:histone H3/H4